MGLVSDLLALLDGAAGGAVAVEHIALLRDSLQAIVKEEAQLREENARLKDELFQVQRRLEEARVPEDFVPHRGCLFRRLPSGHFEDTVYCPACKTPMASLMHAGSFTCHLCGMRAGFNGSGLHKVLAELEKK